MRLLCAIVNWRTPDLTARALRTLVPQLDPRRDRVIVVDNASGDDSVELLRAVVDDEGYRDVAEIVPSEINGGYGHGNNIAFRRGLREASPPAYFYVLNSDAFPEPGAVDTLVRFMDETPDAGIAGSHVRGVDGVPHHTAFRFPSPAGELESTSRLGVVSRVLEASAVALPIPTRTTAVDWVSGASMMIRREVLTQVGLFDETFFLYYEETDLCRRAHDAGWSAYYVPSSSVAHVGSASTKLQDLQRRTPSYWFDSRRHYFLKHHGRRGLWKANAAWLTGSTLLRTRRVLQRRPTETPSKQYRDFIRHGLRSE